MLSGEPFQDLAKYTQGQNPLIKSGTRKASRQNLVLHIDCCLVYGCNWAILLFTPPSCTPMGFGQYYSWPPPPSETLSVVTLVPGYSASTVWGGIVNDVLRWFLWNLMKRDNSFWHMFIPAFIIEVGDSLFITSFVIRNHLITKRICSLYGSTCI